MTPPPLDAERRRPVWAALSELYLDTELEPADHAQIARVLAASGYTDDELEAILRAEVGPVLWPNFFTPAGEWQGFDQDRLADEITRRRTGWRRHLPRYAGFGLVRHHWQKVRAQLPAERARIDTPGPEARTR